MELVQDSYAKTCLIPVTVHAELFDGFDRWRFDWLGGQAELTVGDKRCGICVTGDNEKMAEGCAGLLLGALRSGSLPSPEIMDEIFGEWINQTGAARARHARKGPSR